LSSEPGRLLAISHPAVLPVNQQPYRALRDRGWQVRVVTPRRWKHEFAKRPIRAISVDGFKSELDPLPVFLAGRPQRHGYVARATSELRSRQPTVLFVEAECFSVPAAQWGLAASRLGIPFGVQAAETLDRTLPAVARWIRNAVLPRASFVAARSPTAAALVRRWGAKGIVELIPHHVAVWGEPPPIIRHDVFTVGFAGRLVPEKGLRDLVLATRAMTIPVRVLVVGDGPLRSDLEAEQNVEVWSSCSHERMNEAYQQMDVLVLPSRGTPTWQEQFGRVLVEALSCEVPVIGSTCGEIPWVIETTGGGWIYSEGDVDALATLLDKVANDVVGRAERANAGKAEVARQFSLDATSSVFGALLSKVSL